MVLDLEGKINLRLRRCTASDQCQSFRRNQALEEAMEAMLALGYKATELKKIKKFFEGTTDTAENYTKSALKMLGEIGEEDAKRCSWVKMNNPLCGLS